MPPFRSQPVSLTDIAKVAGVSRMAVSYALRNLPMVGAATRKRILAVAKRLGYVPDARLATLMTGVRAARNRDPLPIAWLNMNENKGPLSNTRDGWRFFPNIAPFLEGARTRCQELGYKLDEIWLHEPGMNSRRMSSILYNRGIQGVILAPSQITPLGHIRLDWRKFTCASFEKGIQAPRVHRATPDYSYNITLALKMLRRLRYRRIGVFLQRTVDRRSQHAYLSGITYFHSLIPERERVPPLLYWDEEMWNRVPASHRNENLPHREGLSGLLDRLFDWIGKYKVDVILCQHSGMIGWLEDRGYRVPKDIGVAHLAVEDDVKDWAGIWQRKREIGAATAGMVISMMQGHQFGLPTQAHDLLIQGHWNPGKTILS